MWPEHGCDYKLFILNYTVKSFLLLNDKFSEGFYLSVVLLQKEKQFFKDLYILLLNVGLIESRFY